jgi:hypothetical protein
MMQIDTTTLWQRYARAERFLPWNTKKLLFNLQVEPRWIGQSDQFWYTRESPAGYRIAAAS